VTPPSPWGKIQQEPAKGECQTTKEQEANKFMTA
jgi:hypothetical protein